MSASNTNELCTMEETPGKTAAARKLAITPKTFEPILLVFSVLWLLASCLVWSAHKQAWMDEIMTWKEASDPSLWHLLTAIQHGADGGQPLFYATVWLWRHI